jgi:hypothetical protein
VNSADRNAADANHNSHILRAKDIIPPYNENPPNTNNPNSSSSDFDIPKFDLAEQILAQQRRLSATKRKSPAQKIDTSVLQSDPRLTYQSARWPAPLSGQQDLIIIKDIVKRDIEKLCRGRRIGYQ